jgi:hypothetical protein
VVGTYRWVAAYSGDANYLPVTAPCNAPNESSVVAALLVPTLATTATPAVSAGQSITDTATVTGVAGGPAPTGTVTFTLFGPNNATCTGPPIFTSANRPLSGGPPTATGTSAPFTPATAGTYRWIAAYSGDANYSAVTAPCNAPNETSVVGQAVPTLVTTATFGQPISDTATLAGGSNPTGTITFTLFGPDNPPCAGSPVITRPLTVAGNGQYSSGPFVAIAPGTYHWVAVYGGDANNLRPPARAGPRTRSRRSSGRPTCPWPTRAPRAPSRRARS